VCGVALYFLSCGEPLFGERTPVFVMVFEVTLSSTWDSACGVFMMVGLRPPLCFLFLFSHSSILNSMLAIIVVLFYDISYMTLNVLISKFDF
jgi:hypothetical protein